MKSLLAWIWLAFGAWWAALGLTATLPWTPRYWSIRLYWDSVALAGSELALQAMVIAVVLSALLWWLGGAQSWPGKIGAGLTLLSLVLMSVALHHAWRDGPLMEQALQASLGADYRARILPERAALLRDRVSFTDWALPLKFDLTGIETIRDIRYGEHGEFNTLDVLRPAGPVVPGRPVIMHMHGGGYMFGQKNAEALPLLHHLARRGWVVVTINYRLSPAARWPAQLVDCKRALAWVRGHIAEHGGDPGFVAVTGGSAGGNLSALLAFTANDPKLQPGFESVDTRVQAAVTFYAGFDPDLPTEHSSLFWTYTQILPEVTRDDPAVQAGIVPSRNIRADAPPFFVLQGSHDALALAPYARDFIRELRAVSRAPVAYAEQVGASHGYDAQHSLRTEYAVDAVQRFLEFVYSGYLRNKRRLNDRPGTDGISNDRE